MNGVGFFGKLPSAGDFVRRRLPADFVTQWDRHCQQAIDAARRELGDAWAVTWRSAPAWRFVIPAQVCGAGAWCGLVGPAFDRVGREFPVVMAAHVGHDVERVLTNEAWFDALDREYACAIDGALSVDRFDARISVLPSPDAPFPRSDGNRSESAVDVYPHDELLHDLVPVIVQDLVQHSDEDVGAEVAHESTGEALVQAWRQIAPWPGAWCLWWTADAARVLATRGLPSSFGVLLANEDTDARVRAGAGAGAGNDLATSRPPGGMDEAQS